MNQQLLSALAAAGTGWVIGVSVAAPVGPVGVLCINRTLNKGFGTGLVSGLGAATADFSYGIVTALGLSALSSFLLKIALPVRIGGLAFLLFLGIKTLLSKPVPAASGQNAEKTDSGGLLKSFFSTFLLTVTNPFTVLFFIGVLTGSGAVTEARSLTDSLILVIGVFLGSLSWWLFLSTVTSLIRKKIRESWFVWINRISGGVLLLLAGYLAYTLIRDVL